MNDKGLILIGIFLLLIVAEVDAKYTSTRREQTLYDQNQPQKSQWNHERSAYFYNKYMQKQSIQKNEHAGEDDDEDEEEHERSE